MVLALLGVMTNTVKRTPTARLDRPSIAALFVAGIVALPHLSGCAPKRHAVMSTETVTAIEEHVPPAPSMIDISIVNLHDEPSIDFGDEKVVGTIINDGDRPVSMISVRVNALDSVGNVVRSVSTPPLEQTIDPFGGHATFEVSMPRDPAVAGYHAVAIAR